MNKQFGCMCFGKAFYSAISVFPNAPHKVACDANIDGAVFLAGHDIDVTAHTLISSVLDPRVKPEDDVGKGGAPLNRYFVLHSGLPSFDVIPAKAGIQV